jgi:hypothetical protein
LGAGGPSRKHSSQGQAGHKKGDADPDERQHTAPPGEHALWRVVGQQVLLDEIAPALVRSRPI